MENLFETDGLNRTIERLDKLTSESTPEWGKMTVSQMLAHCSVAYQMTYDKIRYKNAKGLKRIFLKLFIKKAVVGPKPYKKNGQTAPEFIIKGDREFDYEKSKLINYLRKTQELGSTHFDGRENISFGILSASEWNVLFSKHIDHHLRQFKV